MTEPGTSNSPLAIGQRVSFVSFELVERWHAGVIDEMSFGAFVITPDGGGRVVRGPEGVRLLDLDRSDSADG